MFFLGSKWGAVMEQKVKQDILKIKDTTFYITSVFSGTVDLQSLIKRLIRSEIEQKNSMN